MGITFTDGTYSDNLNMPDQNGNQATHDNVSGQWDNRSIDLTAQAGKTVSATYFLTDGETLPGSWSVDYRDFVYMAANGSVVQLMSGPSLAGAWIAKTPGETSVSAGAAPMGPYRGGIAPLHFYLGDHLGTAQMESATGGWPVWQGQFAPFGVEMDTQSNDSNAKFTGKERDTESGLDYFGARYYGSAMGRFSSPDPSGLVYADPTNPQSLNLYSYAANNPLKNTDPTGLAYCQWDDGSHDDSANTGVAGAVNSGTECTNAGGSWSHADGLGDDGNPLVTRDADLSLTAKYHPPDPDDQRIQELVQGVATDTAGFPTVCSVGGYGQVGLGPVAGGYQYDSSKGGSAYNNFRATPGNPGSMPSIAPGNNGSIPMGDPSPFSATVKRTASGGYSGGATVRDPVTEVGGGVSVNEKGTPTVSASVQRGPVTVGATATLGTIGNPACQMGPVHR